MYSQFFENMNIFEPIIGGNQWMLGGARIWDKGLCCESEHQFNNQYIGDSQAEEGVEIIRIFTFLYLWIFVHVCLYFGPQKTTKLQVTEERENK